MEEKLLEIINWVYTDYKDKVVCAHVLKADTKEELFKKAYTFERSARYDNCRRYEFASKQLEIEYKEWRKTGVTIEMYYGNCVYD